MGKKGAKKAPMTEEEKLIFLEQKAQAEAEMARQKEAARMRQFKLQLREEEKNRECNLLKVTQNWRDIIRRSRAKELRRHIEIQTENTKRVIDHKDYIIQLLMSVLSNTERQTEMAHRAHLEHLNCLLKLHEGLHGAMELQWKKIIFELLSQYDTKREQIKKQHFQQNARLEDITTAMGNYSSEIKGEAKKKFLNASEKMTAQTTEASHNLLIQLGSTLDKLSEQYTTALQYDSSEKKGGIQTKQNSESFHARELRDAQKIELQMNRLQKMQDTIDSLRSQLIFSQRENESCAYGLRAARDDLTRKAGGLKAKLSLTQGGNKGCLTDFTVESNNTTKKIQHFLRKGDKILRKAEICSRLETEQDRVCPFYSSSITSEELTYAMEPPSEQLAQAIVDHTILETFWQHYNKAQLECDCQQRENSILEQENEQLMAVLSMYLNGTPAIQQQNLPVQLSMAKFKERLNSRTYTVESRHANCFKADSENRLLWKRKPLARPQLVLSKYRPKTKRSQRSILPYISSQVKLSK